LTGQYISCMLLFPSFLPDFPPFHCEKSKRIEYGYESKSFTTHRHTQNTENANVTNALARSTCIQCFRRIQQECVLCTHLGTN
jgi:hypothetical protein